MPTDLMLVLLGGGFCFGVAFSFATISICMLKNKLKSEQKQPWFLE